MDSKLMLDFGELEGLNDDFVDDESLDNVVDDDNRDEDDPSMKPRQASTMQSAEVYKEMEDRHLQPTGFADKDMQKLQAALDEEFKMDLEEKRVQRHANKMKAARQAGLQRRRQLMEKTLQEEQIELAQNHQLAMMLDLVKEDKISGVIRLDINSIGARSLAKALWANCTITCVDLSSNNLNDQAGAYIARILKKNKCLKKLELDNNSLGPISCAAFGNSLKVNATLVSLSLDSNPIHPGTDGSGVRELADSLSVNHTLTSLNLWRTGIGSGAGCALANAIDRNSCLLFCDIGRNGIDLCDVKRIVEKIESNVAGFESKERIRRAAAITEEEKAKVLRDAEEEARKEKELTEWLASRRDERAESRRIKEEIRIAEAMAEAEEKKRQIEIQKEAERKAAEEAAAKKAKKAAAKNKKK